MQLILEQKNLYGQILKWIPKNSHKDDEFTWEIFTLVGNPDNQKGLNKGSNNITSENNLILLMDLNLIEMEDFGYKQMVLILIKANMREWEIIVC